MTRPSAQPLSMLRNFLAISALLACASCGNHSPGLMAPDPDRTPTAAEIAQWRSERGFTEASGAELQEAERWKKRFTKNCAVSSDGKRRVVFRCGELVGNTYHGTSTTSIYQLTDASGRVLISAPSRISKSESGKPFMEPEHAWFSPDGSKVLVYENTHANEGALAILFYQDQENNGEWSVRFPDLGDMLNRPFDEGNHTECRGLLGEEILIDNSPGGVSKIRLDRLKEHHPFPFTVG